MSHFPLQSLPARSGQAGEREPLIRYRPDIDGLRAVAIIGVVAYHAGVPLITGGYAGVDVFFVVSGYLITQFLVGSYERDGRVSLSEFYERRARRLLPGLSVVVLATLLIGFVWLPFPNAREELGKSAVATLLFVSNIYFPRLAGDYFGLVAERMPLVHSWSLAVEEQFYLVYPFLLLVLARFAAPAHRMRWLRSAVGLITIASFVFSVVLVRRGSQGAFYWAPSRAWEIGVGALVALFPLASEPRRGGARAIAAGAIAAIIGVVAIAWSFVWLQPTSPFPGILALLPVVGTAVVIAAEPFSPRSLVSRALSVGPLVALGRVSYTWYLWHWPLLTIARSWRLGETDLVADIGWVTLALVLAILTTRFVERPFRHRRDVVLPERRQFVRLAATTIVFLLAMAGVETTFDRFWLAGSSDTEADESPNLCLTARSSGPLSFGNCTAVVRAHPSSVALWGDSHAYAWSPLIKEIADAEGITLSRLTMPSCPPLLGLTPRHQRPSERLLQPAETRCREKNSEVAEFQLIPAARGSLSGVILVARWPWYTGERPINGLGRAFFDSADATEPAALASLRRGLERTLTFTDSIGVRALVFLTPPEFPHPLPDCLIVRGEDRCGITRAELERYRQPTASVIRLVVRNHPNARIVDPIDFFCDSIYCPARVRGSLTTVDADHVSPAASRGFATLLRPDILWLAERR